MTSEEIRAVMTAFSPVKYDGIWYDRISAYTMRAVRIAGTENKYKMVYQLELEDTRSNTVVIAPADKVAVFGGERNDGNEKIK